MFFNVLLICLEGFVTNMREDFGNIPYENPESPIPLPEQHVSESDYGNIAYDKDLAAQRVKSEQYGVILYEEESAKADLALDYGKVSTSTPTTQGLNQSVDIAGAIKGIFRARNMPEITIMTTQNETSATTKPLKTFKTLSSFNGTVGVARIAEHDDELFYRPVTVDDVPCDPKKGKCSTCRDSEGYRIYCVVGTTTPAPSDLQMILAMLVNITEVYWARGDTLTQYRFEENMRWAYRSRNWPVCPTTTSTTETPSPTWAPHEFTGQTMAKCLVCGMVDSGIPQEDHVCSDSFLSNSYRTHCKFLNRDGWHINASQGGGSYMWGRWTGGCGLRYTDISPIYTQRTCRDNVTPAVGYHYVSKRMAQLEYVLRRQKDGCISSPIASLVPLSRGISLFSRFHACVCSGNYCNHAARLPAVLQWYTVAFVVAYGCVWLYEVLQWKVTF